MSMLKKGNTVGIVGCSNGLDEDLKDKITELQNTFKHMGLNSVISEKLYKKYSAYNGTGKERAEILMNFYRDKEIKVICDVSGGDLSNEVLEYLNFDEIKKCNKPYFGYSDLTVVINAIYSKTGRESYLYQIRNLVDCYKDKQIKDFEDTFFKGNASIYDFDYDWIQGSKIEGIVVGGNIRCLLKLSGTEYMPDFKNKILFLESFSGDVPKMATYLTQYRQMGILKEVKGIILGSYTEMESKKYSPTIVELVKKTVDNSDIPIIKTSEIGHGKDSKCIVIGRNINLHR